MLGTYTFTAAARRAATALAVTVLGAALAAPAQAHPGHGGQGSADRRASLTPGEVELAGLEPATS